MKTSLSIVLLFAASCINYAVAQTDSLHKRSPYISVNAGYESSLTNPSGGVVFSFSAASADNRGQKAYNFYAEIGSYYSVSGLMPVENSMIGIPFSISYSQPWFDVKNFAATQNNNPDMDEYTGTSAGRYKILSLMTGADFLLLKQEPVTIELKLMTGLIFVNEPRVNYTFLDPYAAFYNNNNGVPGPEPDPNQILAQTTTIGLACSAGLTLGYKITPRFSIALNCDILFSYLNLPTSENGADMIDFHTSAGIIYSLGK
jgi:hypothetical protein